MNRGTPPRRLALQWLFVYNGATEILEGFPLQFEWDEEKAALNLKKHGVRFETAALVFCDENRIELSTLSTVARKSGTIPSAW